MKNLIWILGALYCLISPAYANDGIASVSAGGIELLKTDDIQMVSEVLEISTKQIKVKYHFLNTSSSDIKTTVAFPMPAFSNEGGRSENGPLTVFKLFVNGTQVQVKMSRVFRIKGSDTTDQLRKIGLSEKQIFDPNFNCFNGDMSDVPDAVCKLSHEQFVAIEKLGNEVGGDSEIQETVYWEQIFPAGKEIEVIHEYKPFTGWFSLPAGDGAWQMIERLFHKKATCMNDKAIKTIIKNYKKGKIHSDLRIGTVEYILGTGRNWKGPIKDFKLILRKDLPEQGASLCFPGKSVKTSPTTIEFTHNNFVPQDKLHVIFYHWGDRLDDSND